MLSLILGEFLSLSTLDSPPKLGRIGRSEVRPCWSRGWQQQSKRVSQGFLWWRCMSSRELLRIPENFWILPFLKNFQIYYLNSMCSTLQAPLKCPVCSTKIITFVERTMGIWATYIRFQCIQRNYSSNWRWGTFFAWYYTIHVFTILLLMTF